MRYPARHNGVPSSSILRRSGIEFTNYSYDPVIDKYFAQAQFYDAGQGRMLAVDPIRTEINAYLYCRNNPLKYIDPDGRTPVPSWARNINSGNANAADYKNALVVYDNNQVGAWTGTARTQVDRAIDRALEQRVLRKGLNSVISRQMSHIKNASTIFHNSTNVALDIILNYDKQITATANKYGLNKALIQSVLMREIRWIDVTDEFADGLVIQTKVYYDQLDVYKKWPLLKQLIVGPPEAPIGIRDDSSTGLGQIFAETAIKAMNWYFKKIGCDTRIDFNNRQQRFNVWDKLRTNNQYNIDMVGLVLFHKSSSEEELNLNPNTSNPNEIRRILARYNGFGDKAAKYGRETYEYYLLFSRFNK